MQYSHEYLLPWWCDKFSVDPCHVINSCLHLSRATSVSNKLDTGQVWCAELIIYRSKIYYTTDFDNTNRGKQRGIVRIWNAFGFFFCSETWHVKSSIMNMHSDIRSFPSLHRKLTFIATFPEPHDFISNGYTYMCIYITMEQWLGTISSIANIRFSEAIIWQSSFMYNMLRIELWEMFVWTRIRRISQILIHGTNWYIWAALLLNQDDQWCIENIYRISLIYGIFRVVEHVNKLKGRFCRLKAMQGDAGGHVSI